MTDESPGTNAPRPPLGARIFRAAWPWLLVVAVGTVVGYLVRDHIKQDARGEDIKWRDDNALWLVLGAAFVGLILFHLQRRRAASMGYTQVGLVGSRGVGAWLSDVPGVLRVLAVAASAVALARPETYRTVVRTQDSVDIMIVFDMSKSMEEADLPRDRMDAAQRVVRRFLRRTKHDRVGLVIFGKEAMLHTPLTHDTKMLEQIVKGLRIGDVPALGTAIGDGLAMAVASLRRSDGQCDPSPTAKQTCPKDYKCDARGFCQSIEKKRSKVVVLLSDGDNNYVTRFDPDEAARAATAEGITVYTVLVGREDSDVFGSVSVNPETLRSIAQLTGGEFFRATDIESFERGFAAVRAKLDTKKRQETERIPDKQLFVPLALIAALLLLLETVLSHTRLRRLP